jgi:hypothetical protein
MAQKSNTVAKKTTPAKTIVRSAHTLERAVMLCPNAVLAGSLETRFGLNGVDFHHIRETTEDFIVKSAQAIEPNMNERALVIHLQRIVGSFVASACGAGEFYSAKVTTARELTTALSNDPRDEDRDGVAGFQSKAQNARHFAAQVGLQAYALLAAAQGAVDAFAAVTGSTWMPYSNNPTQSVNAQAAQVELDAFDAR